MEQTITSQQNQPAAASAQNSARQYIRPVASITETANGFLVAIEMPGVNRNALEITFENGELTVVGRRPATAGHSEGSTPAETLHRESRPGDYRRSFEVDSTIDAARIVAKLDQGLLTLNLPKAESALPRRIEISGLN